MTGATWSNASFDYAGAAVLVTGGTSGIGAGIAAAYREAGADVTITGTRGSAADYDIDLAGYRYLQLDVESNADIDRVAAAQDRLDILINNAGFALPSMGIDEYEPDNFERAVRMHLVSVFRMSAACAGALARSALPGGASIIGIGSMASFFGIEIVPGYGAGKSGLVGLTKALAIHWAKDNIRVNAVAAGLTESRMTAATIANPAWSGPTLARTPLARFGKPIDIAGPVLFLTSAAAGFITGQTIPVDGGYTVAG
jgi:NAD(P)-dependent dehydrogenase (short-subunit alcohol dehydrogenase family)